MHLVIEWAEIVIQDLLTVIGFESQLVKNLKEKFSELRFFLNFSENKNSICFVEWVTFRRGLNDFFD